MTMSTISPDGSIHSVAMWYGFLEGAIAFETKRFGSLTLSLSSSETEGVSLFNRTTQKQISAYPRLAFASISGQEEDRALNVVRHEVTLSINPETFVAEMERALATPEAGDG